VEGSVVSKRTEAGQARGERARRKILDEALAQVSESGFRAVSVESIAAGCGVAKTTVYRRWPNKAAIVMDAFMDRVGSGTLFPPAEKAMERVRLQMRSMAKAFRGRDGALVKALLAEAQFDAELAKEFRERWTLPRRAMGVAVIRDAIRGSEVRPDADPEMVIDLLYAPMYYRLQMGTGPLSEAYIDGIFRLAMVGLDNSRLG
jgi:AcrR family transcriptional regulator